MKVHGKAEVQLRECLTSGRDGRLLSSSRSGRLVPGERFLNTARIEGLISPRGGVNALGVGEEGGDLLSLPGIELLINSDSRWE